MKVPALMQTTEFWEFRETLAQAGEVTVALDGLIERVRAGDPLPVDIALTLLEAVAAGRPEHFGPLHTQVWAPGDTYEVCRCGSQVMPVYGRTDGAEPGVCQSIKHVDFLLRKALRIPLPGVTDPQAPERPPVSR